MDPSQVKAYRVDSGEEVYIPESWIGHPTLGAPFTTEPPRSQKAAGKAAKAAQSTPAAGDEKE